VKKITFLYLFFFLQIVSFGQEAEYYRFSFDYFVREVKKGDVNRTYYLKSDKGWVKVSSKSIDGKSINQMVDWKIEEKGKEDQGAFSEGGVYSVTNNVAYEALKRKWLHQYYKPIWEIRMRELKLDIKYDTSKTVKIESSEKVFDIAENSPEFAAGQMNLYRYLSKSIRVGKTVGSSTRTKLFVQFVVYENGKIGEIEVIRGISKDLDKEVVRVLKGMPNWIPARQKGKCVASRVIIPIEIKIR